MFCEQLLRKANERKAEIIKGRGDPWVTRQQLRELYQQLLVTDLEFALDKKVEQDLWNHAFKNQISALQHKAKDKTNPKRSEVQAMLTLFLDSGSGFYLQLLQDLCSSFKLDIPCCVTAPRLGMAAEQTPPLSANQHKTAPAPAHASVLYICQHCLVHLGDLARYRNETNQSESYYLQAAHLVPSNGQPYNQLAIVAASKADQLAMTFYYIRSIAVKHPFPAAATNLQTTFSKLVDRDEVKLFKMKEVELIHFFIKFHAIVYLAMTDQDLQIASAIKDKLEENFRSHLSQETLNAQQLVQIAAINLFALHCVCLRQQDVLETGEVQAVQDGCYVADEARTWNLVFGLTITLLQLMLHYTPCKTDGKPLQWCGLPAVKILLDWLVHQPSLFLDPAMSAKSVVWGKFARVLNSVQPEANITTKHGRVPLPEDIILNGFLPLQDLQDYVEFVAVNQPSLPEDTQWTERAHRLVAHGKLVAKTYPEHLKAESTGENTALITFSSQSADEQTRRQHHQKLKIPKSSQQQHHQTRHQQTALGQGSRPGAKRGRDAPRKIDSSTEPAIGERGGATKAPGSAGGRKGSDGGVENKTHSVAIQAILPRPPQTSAPDTLGKSTEPILVPAKTQNRSTDGKPLHDPNPIPSPTQRQHPYHSPTHSPNSGFRHPVGQPIRHHPPPPPWSNQYPPHHPPPHPGLPQTGHHVPPSYPPHRGPHQHPPRHMPHSHPLPHPRGPAPHPHGPLPIPRAPPPNPHGPLPNPHIPPPPVSHAPPPTLHAPPPTLHRPPPNLHRPPPQPFPSPSQGQHRQALSQTNSHNPPQVLPGPSPNFPGHAPQPRPNYPHEEKNIPPWLKQQHQDQERTQYDFRHQNHEAPPPTSQNFWSKNPAVSNTGPSMPPPKWGVDGVNNQMPDHNRGQIWQSNPIQQQQQEQHLELAAKPSMTHKNDQNIPRPDPFQRQRQHQEIQDPQTQPLIQQPQELSIESLQKAQQLISQNTLNQNILELLSTLQKQMAQTNDPSEKQLPTEQQSNSSQNTNSLNPQSLNFMAQLNQLSPDTQNQSFLGSDSNKQPGTQPSPFQKPFQSAFPNIGNFDDLDTAKTTSDFSFPKDGSTYLSPQHHPYTQHPGRKSPSYPSNFQDLQISEQANLFRSSPSSQLQSQNQHLPDWSINDGSGGHRAPSSQPTLFPTNEEISKMQKIPGFSTWPDKFSMDEYQPRRDVPTLLSPATSSSSLGLSPTPSSQPALLNTTSPFVGKDSFGSSQSSGRSYDSGGRSSLFPDSSERKSSLEDSTLGTSPGYSLFSYSPWSGGKKDGHNLTASPFSSSPSSPRSQSPSVQQPPHPLTKNHLGGGLGSSLGWGPDSRGMSGWSNRGHQLSSSPTSGLLPDSIQSIWSSPLGSTTQKASPLEELLKRQQMTDQR